MDIQKLKPALKDYIWGGRKLYNYGITSDLERIAEAWILSMHPDGISALYDGTPLINAATADDLGKACAKFDNFPILVKLIDAKENLSVQVHPSDEYALKNENSYGKTEMWYIIECDENAGIYLGFKNAVTKTEFVNAIKDGTLTDLLQFVPVKKGDCYFIPAGTIHAIGKGCTICEVQQNSNITYRVFDYNRVGADGKARQLHIDKAVEVTMLDTYKKHNFGAYLSDCEYFTVAAKKGSYIFTRTESFTNIVCLNGCGTINGLPLTRGDSYFVPSAKAVTIEGNVEYLEIFIR